MKVTAIVAEFNPFHSGHGFLIKKAREITKADLVIALMSGNFVQRGEPAVFDMGIRVRAALSGGCDMVFELPPAYALSSAEGFAYGALSILSGLGADSLVFGSESGDIKALSKIADKLHDESPEYKASLKQHLKEGLNYPSAREKALKELLPSLEGTDILNNPNNILGIEYLKAIRKLGSSIKPYTLRRVNSSYHSDPKGNVSNITTYSAEELRNRLFTAKESNAVSSLKFPGLEYITEAAEKEGIVGRDSLTPLLLYVLLDESLKERLEKGAVPKDLSNRIMANRYFSGSFSEYCALIKTKNITYSAVSRHLLHLILNMDQRKQLYTDYVRLLGFKKEAEPFLNQLLKGSKLSVLSNSSDIKSYLNRITVEKEENKEKALLSLNDHLYIDRIYEVLREDKKRREHPLPPEISRQIVIV